MELQEYTTEQLKNELKRRAEAAKKQKEDVARCRNCKHLVSESSSWYKCYKCGIRTFKQKGRTHHYIVNLYRKACVYYERSVTPTN